MASRKKRLRRQEKGLKKQAAKHRIKAKTEKGEKDTTHDYWLGEAERFEERARQRAEMREKLEGKKHENKESGENLGENKEDA